MFVGLLIRVLAFLSLTVGAMLPAADFPLQVGSAAIDRAGVDLSLESDLTGLARSVASHFLITGDATPPSRGSKPRRWRRGSSSRAMVIDAGSAGPKKTGCARSPVWRRAGSGSLRIPPRLAVKRPRLQTQKFSL